MEKQYVHILDIPFINKTKNEVVNDVFHQYLKEGKKGFIVTANPEIVMQAQKDRDYFYTLSKADFIVPDGIGVVIASKMKKKPLKERVPGFELMKELLELGHKHGLSVYIVGAKPEVLDKAVANIRAEYPGLKLAGYHHGYFNDNDGHITEEIQRTKPDLILAALGFPRQEQWIKQNIQKVDKGVFIGVGGSIDVLAGHVKRAPVFWQKIHLEWFYRLMQQPSRWRRMLVLPQFLIQVMRTRG
ncbi:WecB/TagA/CpsF family glycosyltransferase [Rossellomorea aquimaris]|uniref:N-acetylglucosaminyldiphosphoundecaprenol N-acetyl-beta-D-mannosaminyltransferase n=1 Tax=Rossellomorea aquimaris TaxID=189382 RepID=A0A1J6W743_9BACI|nr:WecB/TagA/CpsF family glycosyltransferase [Rossellomorea aquimaris]OIU67680.1 acetylglucosaminyldiphospho-UDP acetyl-beta-D-mannosaminyltransferase [Rossellomorea aquimaris]